MEKLRASSKDNSRRKFSGGGPRPDNAEHKRKEAAERQKAWEAMSPVRRLEALDVRLGGKGVGAKKQRERLHAEILKKRPAMGANIPPEREKEIIAKMEAQGFDVSRIKAKDRRAEERAKRPSK